jgi:RimJ/RimL family protein N-acetyltransferase
LQDNDTTCQLLKKAMTLTLRPFTLQDIPLHQQWCKAIHAERYMSRTAPHLFLEQGSITSPLFVWSMILLDARETGTLWLEKAQPADETATLGILLGDSAQFGHGIGQQAIPLGIQQAACQLSFHTVTLNVRQSNLRAIACYQKCGFQIIKEGSKDITPQKCIPFYEMQLQLNF